MMRIEISRRANNEAMGAYAIRTRFREESFRSMDTLKLLKEEANRKRKALQETAASKGKKYLKRADLESLSTGGEGEGETEAAKVRKESETSVVLSPTTPNTPGDDNPVFAIPRTEVVWRLRERGEPIRLFGESDREVCLRLRQIEILAPEINKGLRNDLKDAMDKLDQEYLTQIAMQQGEEGADSAELRVRDDGTTLDDIMKVWSEFGSQPTEDQKQELCLKTLRFMLKEWAAELNARPLADKRSYQGKLDSGTFKQTEAYLKPLFKQLRKKSIAADILTFLSNICGNLLEREYVKANGIYLQMAIGNAPWPIGVTMVGIHARTGREKIFAQQIAHVLNDETQRKYIQGVKRLMTFCQRKYITVPSKCVEYNGLKPRSS